MKKYSFLSFLLFANFFTFNLFSMDQRHIPRKKTRKHSFRNSQEEEMARLINEENDNPYCASKPKRSRPIDITKATRRFSTGQIDMVHHVSEKEISFSPRLLKRENSQGSITITPEKEIILRRFSKEEIDRKSQEQLKKLHKSQEVSPSSSPLKNSAKWLVLRSSLEKTEEKK